MTALLVPLFAALRATLGSRLELEAEILALRHQLAALQRQAPKRPRLGHADRLLWVLLSRLWPNWRRAIHIVTPDTVVDTDGDPRSAGSGDPRRDVLADRSSPRTSAC